jgi:hypothetical protein
MSMTINETIVKELEHTWRKPFPDELKKYLLSQYAQEPFPHEFSEQDLYANIERDIRVYEAGKLDVTLKSQSERWQDEREYLQNLYIEKCREARELVDYVAELEQMLAQNSLESPKMAKRRLEFNSL